jgi:hypothetical protein
MTIKDSNYWKKLAKSNAKTIDKILWFGLLFSITVIFMSFTGIQTVSISNISLPIKYVWIIYVLFTIFHFIYTQTFESSVRQFWRLTEPNEYCSLYKDITTEEGYFMRGMEPRVLSKTSNVAPMGNDLSTWLSHITAILLFVALWRTVQLDISPWLDKIIVIGLTLINWIIGSRWAIVLSELTIEKKYARILSKRNPLRTPTLFDDTENVK